VTLVRSNRGGTSQEADGVTSRSVQKGRFAVHDGIKYDANVDVEGRRVQLYSTDPSAVERGFEPAGQGRYRRSVPADDVDALYDVHTLGRWRGEPFEVVGEHDGRWDLWYLGRNSDTARQLGLEQYDRGVWRITVDPAEVTDVHTERRDLPRQ